MSNQNDMELKEYKLYQPVKTWLIENDYEVFAEWIMGYKIGHTVLSASAIQWFRSQLKQPLKNCRESHDRIN